LPNRDFRRQLLAMTLRITRLLVVMALLLSATAARAQTWTGGVKGGLGQGGFTGSQEFDWNQRSLSTAIFLNRSLSERFGFQPELAHLQKVGISIVGSSQLTLAVDYLEMPLLLQFKLPRVAGVMPFLLGGPNVALSLSCTLKFVGGGLSTSDNCNSGGGTVRSRTFDFGGTVGAGISWGSGLATFGLEGRASAGLRSLVAPVEATNSRSFGWSVMASVSMPISQTRIPRGGPRGGTIPRPGVAVPLPMVPMPAQILARPDRSVPFAGVSSTKLITVNAVDADARNLLISIAQEAGINMVISPDVRSRVTVRFLNIPAMEAVQASILQAGLQVALPPTSGASPAIVCYHLASYVNEASRETIEARFGVTSEMAIWIVESRPANQKP
jgi:hypothetical protein